jgi:uncharacterized membrane protein YfcA
MGRTVLPARLRPGPVPAVSPQAGRASRNPKAGRDRFIPPLGQDPVKPGAGGDLPGQRGGNRGELAALGPHQVPQVSAGPVEQGHLRQRLGADVAGMAVAALLLPLGIWLTATRPARNHNPDQPARPARHIPAPLLIGLAAVTGCVGGIYGIGGGAILAPILIGTGRPAAEVAPAALASTFVTSLGGVLTFTLLSIREGPVAPNWPTGIAPGIGGIAGGYLGARMQSRLPDTLIRRTVGILAIAIAAQFLKSGLIN